MKTTVCLKYFVHVCSINSVNLSHTVYVTTSLSTMLFSLVRSAGTAFSLSISILPSSSFKLTTSDFAAKLDISRPAVPYKFAFVI